MTFTFSKPYAPWKVMLDTSRSPAARAAGRELQRGLEHELQEQAGPGDGERPVQAPELHEGPEPRRWSATRASAATSRRSTKITFVFRTNTDTEIQAIRGGEVDAIYPQPQLQLAALKGQAGLRVQSNAGTTIEHLDLNTGAGNSNPLLGQRWFRQAIAYSLDRQAMIRQLFRTLNPSLPVLQNLTYTTNQRGLYKAHFQRYTRNLAKVTALFEAHNCTKGGDGIYVVRRHACLRAARHHRRQPAA